MACIKLSNPPAFGFEFASCNAYGISKSGANQQNQGTTTKKVNQYVKNNILKVLGYIPILGSLVGLVHLNQSKKMRGANKVNHVARGVIETFSLGLLLLIPDLLITAGRAIRTALPGPSAHPNN